MTKRAFGELEASIMHIMQGQERLTVKDVHRLLGGQDKYTTIMTVMNRLSLKNVLGRERIGLHYEYWVNPSVKTPSLLQQLKNKLFGVKTASLISHLIEESDDLTDADLEQMEKLIRQAKDKRKGGHA